MNSFFLLVLPVVLLTVKARPRDRLSRRGAYDDWKTVPFVDNEEHKVLGEYDRESHSKSCQDNSDCAAGRMCKFGLCLCGQPDMCAGHSKPVCGSDGRRYPSHCELHRTACVLGVHIKLDRAGTCLTEDDKKYRSVPKKTAIKVAKDDDMMQQDASSLEYILPNGNGLLAESTTVKPTSGSGANKSDKNGNTIDDNSSNASETTVQIPADENRVTNQVTTSKVIVDKKEYENDSLTIVGSLNKNDTLNVENNSTDPQNYDDYNNNVSTEEIDSDDLQDIYNENMESKSELKDDYDDDYEDVSVSIVDTVEAVTDKPSLVPLYCTPDLYVRFKADILQYHCIYFKEEHCDGQTQQEKQRLAAIMFNYYDKDFSGYINKEELWAMQLLERMDELSSLCTLLDIVLFDELGPKDGKLSADEFIQAFDIPDVLEHKTVVVPLLATVGNGLEVKCDVANTKDVIWKRNSVDLATVDFPGITVLGDGSLYIETVGFHVVGNLTCHDRRKPSVKQIHMLTVHKPPHVQLLTKSLHVPDGVDLVIQCHVEGYPRPSVTWHAHDRPLENGPKYHIQSYDDTLTVHNVNYAIDSGVYTCQVKNTAGMAEGMVTITVNAPNDTKPSDVPPVEESFLIFHDDGYTLKEPSQCLTQRHVKPDFGNFFFLPDELDAPPSLCEPGIPCVWGGAVNVKGMFVYVTQPRQNRVVVIDVKETLNPNQVISTDKMPVSLHYMEHLDEVWVLCWNGEENGGSKTIVIIRNASQKIQHHVVHTQPIGNRYDQVQDVFLPPSSELHHPYRYGYTVHRGQEGMFKVDLDLQKYAKAVDLTKFECVPFAVAFVPLGGNIIVQCVKETSYNRITSLLTLDMITDIVLNNMTSEAVVYVSPDVGNVVFVDEASGNIAVHQVSENGEITHQFDVTLGTQVGKATFHKANYYHGYDLYLTGKVKEVVFSVGLDNGKIESFTDIGTPEQEMLLPWLSHDRPLISGDIFSDYLATTADSSMLVLDSVRHEIKCHVQELQHPSLIVHTHLNEH
ncbi:follistatin-related protein 5-like isoform X2 [Dreissena polymorpha]|uniref:follistatin-related protein 5-like isoform X2 n=1 Tax=Dreissena polymorpha TaxID=45954 RepID=UPI002264D792|nr:follistatin-related protein 5-like isoform X2 [Dreissena polymorpha]